MPFFDIGTSKSAPGPSVFQHFHLKMRFSPQRRTIFQHPNFKKCSRNVCFLKFWLLNALLATTACHFSTSEHQKVPQDPQLFSILTSTCASRHSGVQFLISPLTAWLRTRRFNEPTFRHTRHTNHWKNTAFRDFFSNLARVYLLSSDFHAIASSFFWLYFSSSAFHLLFNSPYCRKFTI